MIGKRIKEERLKKGISQEELSKFVSVTQQAVNKWETDKSNPDPESINRLADYFGCSADYLLGRTDERRPAEKVIEEAISDDPELLEFFKELSKRDDLQLMFKQTKDLSQDSIRRIIKYIKMVEDEESRE